MSFCSGRLDELERAIHRASCDCSSKHFFFNARNIPTSDIAVSDSADDGLNGWT